MPCLQVGDLKGFFGLFMVNMQLLRAKAKVLDMSYGTGTGKLVVYATVGAVQMLEIFPAKFQV